MLTKLANNNINPSVDRIISKYVIHANVVLKQAYHFSLRQCKPRDSLMPYAQYLVLSLGYRF